MKKMISVVLITASLFIFLTSCGKFTCDICGKETRQKKNEINYCNKDMTVCADCLEDVNEILENQNND